MMGVLSRRGLREEFDAAQNEQRLGPIATSLLLERLDGTRDGVGAPTP